MPDIVLLKLGGSLITEKSRPETTRPEVIARLAGEIAQAAAALPGRLIVGHGSGSFGHVAAHRSGIAPGLASAAQLPGVSETQRQAALLHRLVFEALAAAGAPPFSIAPSSCVVAAGGVPVALAEEPLLLALGAGLLPVVYGDVVLDREQGVAICSTERLFLLLAERLPGLGVAIGRAIWLGETDGVYDAAGRTIPRLAASSAGGLADILRALGSPAGADVTGGMRHRVETALALARLGIPSLIANGLEPGVLGRALAGEEVNGTEVV
jgi:isopentenyl phosphate kinase